MKEEMYIRSEDFFSDKHKANHSCIDYKIATKILKPELMIPNFASHAIKLIAKYYFNVIFSLLFSGLLFIMFITPHEYWKQKFTVFALLIMALDILLKPKNLVQFENKIAQHFEDSIFFTTAAILDTAMYSNRDYKGKEYRILMGYITLPMFILVLDFFFYYFGIEISKENFFYQLLNLIFNFYTYNLKEIFIVLFIYFFFTRFSFKYYNIHFFFVFLVLTNKFIFKIEFLSIIAWSGFFLSIHLILGAFKHVIAFVNNSSVKFGFFYWVWLIFSDIHFLVSASFPYRILPGILVIAVFLPLRLFMLIVTKYLKIPSALRLLGLICTAILIWSIV